MDYQKLFKNAYEYMDQPMIEEDCGKLCDCHCCRNYSDSGEKMGIYLLPFEYESILQDTDFSNEFSFEKHMSEDYYIAPKIKYLYYFYCDQVGGCLRKLRPIQCRTYPFEPHLIGNTLSLVVEKDQIHQCPLLNRREEWREGFIEGIFKGWEILLQIPEIRYLVAYDSEERKKGNNIKMVIKEKKYKWEKY